MGFFDKFSKKDHSASSQQIIESMLRIAQANMESEDYARAVETYKSILRMQPNATAQYNLGSLYAQGKGVVRDFREAGYWFRQAELSGDSQAGKMCTKCLMDHVQWGIGDKTPQAVYDDMLAFVRYVYPGQNAAAQANSNLLELAQFHLGKQNFAVAAKLLRATAEFGADGNAQNLLGVLYNAGAGVEKNDLVSLYWFDKAADQGIEKALADRDGILNAYRNNLSSEEFYDYMARLSGWCAVGSRNVPRDARKAKHWNTVAVEAVRAQSAQEDAQPERDELDGNILRIISELKEGIQKIAPIRPGQRVRRSCQNQDQHLHFEFIGVKCFGIDPEENTEFKGYRILLEAECRYGDEWRSNGVRYPFKTEEELFAFMDDPCGFPAACKKLVMRTHADRSPASAAENDEHVNDKTDASDSANQASQSKAASSADYAHKRPDDRISLRYVDPKTKEERIIADDRGVIQNFPGFAPEVYLDTKRFPHELFPIVQYRLDVQQLSDGRDLFLWTVQGTDEDEEIILYSVMKDGMLMTPFRYYKIGTRMCFDSQEGLDTEAEIKRWIETVSMIVRLAFCGKVYLQGDHYAFRLGILTLDMPGAKTLTDVCLLYRSMAPTVQEQIEAEYARTWNTAHVLELVQDPAPYLPQMERVYAQILSDVKRMEDRPSVPHELFWICPRRTALLALETAGKDLKNVK